MRTPIIAGNWKMNNTNAAAEQLINELKPLVADAKAEVVICVPYTAIATAAVNANLLFLFCTFCIFNPLLQRFLPPTPPNPG